MQLAVGPPDDAGRVGPSVAGRRRAARHPVAARARAARARRRARPPARSWPRPRRQPPVDGGAGAAATARTRRIRDAARTGSAHLVRRRAPQAGPPAARADVPPRYPGPRTPGAPRARPAPRSTRATMLVGRGFCLDVGAVCARRPRAPWPTGATSGSADCRSVAPVGTQRRRRPRRRSPPPRRGRRPSSRRQRTTVAPRAATYASKSRSPRTSPWCPAAPDRATVRG